MIKKRIILVAGMVFFLIAGNAVAVNVSSNTPYMNFFTRPVGESSVLLFFGVGLISLAGIFKDKFVKR